MTMGIVEQALASVTGNVETALLVIHDYRELAGKMAAFKIADGNALQALKEAQTAAAETGVKISDALSSITSSMLAAGQTPSYPEGTDRVLKVKFNPSQLTVNASTIPRSQMDAQSGQSRTMAAEDANLNLTVTLYFDDMDVCDSFMWDKFTAGPASVQGAANLVKTGMSLAGKGRVFTVQTEVEALVSALRNPFTRTISFRWNDFVFIGQLNTVQAQYTMFSTSGRPVRAQVLLRVQHEMDPVMLKGWYESYTKVFGAAASDQVKAGQKLGNLVNVHI